MRVAITGGSGFIGSLLVKYHLDRGDGVRLLTRKEESRDDHSTGLEIYHADLTKQSEVLNDFVDGVDILYHCAGESIKQDLMYQTHVEGTKNLICAAAGKIGRWIQLSSVGVYGQGLEGSITEASKLTPVGIYETTKMLSDQLVMEAGKKESFQWVILRPTTVFGSSMTNRSLFQLLEKIKRKHFFFIGKPGAVANYIHVNNVIAALVLCAICPPSQAGNIYNLSSDCAMEDFVNTLASNLGVIAPHYRVPELPVRVAAKILGQLPGFPLTLSRVNALTRRTKYPIDKIQNELTYQPVISLEEGLRQFVVSWQERR